MRGAERGREEEGQRRWKKLRALESVREREREEEADTEGQKK